MEKTNFDKAQDLLEKYAHPDAEVLSDKLVGEIEQLITALTAEKENAAEEVASVHLTLAKLSAEDKIKGKFVVGNDLEYDYYQLETGDETPLTLVLFPAEQQYEWKLAEDLQFGVDTQPAFDLLHKDLTVLRKSNLFHRLFNATQADTRNPATIAKLEELLEANGERKKKALVTEWRETLEYVLADLKDERSGKSVLVDQDFPFTRNGKTKAYKILKADRTGLVVMIDEDLELDRKFPLDSYAYEMIVAFMPMLRKYKGKSPSAKPAGRSGKAKVKAPEVPLPAEPALNGVPSTREDHPENLS
ncbi:MAG: hypothetical protein AVDCRST_MAG56-8165 [uncultured Cytophagales bacterium]|uniref:Uncharacterized protein n=1 Tax=uncultured Cytophagales bacterium TaxID=158755 RepID=A0A6J4M1N3_9SPHI|nr:MAG: hypothetical protein AVDCRST_MAG56-8165 [uncultured Cytophagales bacterium]